MTIENENEFRIELLGDASNSVEFIREGDIFRCTPREICEGKLVAEDLERTLKTTDCIVSFASKTDCMKICAKQRDTSYHFYKTVV